MKKSSRIIAWIVLILWFAFFSYTGALAQTKSSNIERHGNEFIQKSNRVDSSTVIKTNYVYVDSKGQRDTIYISPTGKAFVYRISKKTGNVYKRYLPEITKQLKKEGKI